MTASLDDAATALLCATDATIGKRMVSAAEMAASSGGNALMIACESLGVSYGDVIDIAMPHMVAVMVDFADAGIELGYRDDGQLGGSGEVALEAACRIMEQLQ